MYGLVGFRTVARSLRKLDDGVLSDHHAFRRRDKISPKQKTYLICILAPSIIMPGCHLNVEYFSMKPAFILRPPRTSDRTFELEVPCPSASCKPPRDENCLSPRGDRTPGAVSLCSAIATAIAKEAGPKPTQRTSKMSLEVAAAMMQSSCLVLILCSAVARHAAKKRRLEASLGGRSKAGFPRCEMFDHQTKKVDFDVAQPNFDDARCRFPRPIEAIPCKCRNRRLAIGCLSVTVG